MAANSDLVTRVRLQVMRTAISTGALPDAAAVAGEIDAPAEAVVDAFRQLHDAHVFVLEPDQPDRLRMANPFSGVPTPFRAQIGYRSWYGNCVWDGLGIIAMLSGNGVLATRCPQTGEPLAVGIADGRVAHGQGIVFFGVPARDWWSNIIHT